ncbi:hypothetical protein NQZ68_028034 [Dissostichus eleginoides]|nr:hypothetical protein NQZ68_028034 [Dissostichus eleginoides]
MRCHQVGQQGSEDQETRTESGGEASQRDQWAGETDSKKTRILIHRREEDEEQILGWQAVMRSLLGGWRGRCWPEEV